MPLTEKLLQIKFGSIFGFGAIVTTKCVHNTEKHKPTKYTKPLICPLMTEPSVIYPTIKKGAKRKNIYISDAMFISSIFNLLLLFYTHSK